MSATSPPPPDGRSPTDDSGGEFVDLPRRLQFLELSAADQDRLRSLAPRLGGSAPEFVEEFYRHLFRFEETAGFLQDPQLVQRLKELQRDHLESMLEARWDAAYLARRQRVGDVHAQIGINPQMFLGAYNQYLQFCFRQLAPADDAVPRQTVEEMLSLLKVVLLDVGLTLDAYFLQATSQLRQALEMVFEANAELRQFAQLASHDLKTPLATVANLCDEVLDEFSDRLPAEASRLVEAARQRAFRMSTTIDELLHSTMSLQGGDALAEVATSEVIAEAIDQIRPQLVERDIALDVASDIPRVLGDRVRIREAFCNLLSNAAKFIDKRPGRIAIDFEARGDDLIVTVADNGPGIPREEWTRVFVPFRRLRMHQDVPGSGLGLYFTKNMIEQQGGRIWVDGEPGQGSRFHVQLKRARQ